LACGTTENAPSGSKILKITAKLKLNETRDASNSKPRKYRFLALARHLSVKTTQFETIRADQVLIKVNLKLNLSKENKIKNQMI